MALRLIPVSDNKNPSGWVYTTNPGEQEFGHQPEPRRRRLGGGGGARLESSTWPVRRGRIVGARGGARVRAGAYLSVKGRVAAVWVSVPVLWLAPTVHLDRPVKIACVSAESFVYDFRTSRGVVRVSSPLLRDERLRLPLK